MIMAVIFVALLLSTLTRAQPISSPPVVSPVGTPAEGCSCQNGGSCVNGQCFCPPGFVGAVCDLPVAICSDDVFCYNRGSCEENALGTYVCNCAPGFVGGACDVAVCSGSLSCFNGGLCETTASGDFACRCASYFAGDKCEYSATTICGRELWEFCVNGGVCRASGIGCLCADGFEGERCEISTSDASPVTLSPDTSAAPFPAPVMAPIGSPTTVPSATAFPAETEAPFTSFPVETMTPNTVFPVETFAPVTSMPITSMPPVTNVPVGIVTDAPVTMVPGPGSSAPVTGAPAVPSTSSPTPASGSVQASAVVTSRILSLFFLTLTMY